MIKITAEITEDGHMQKFEHMDDCFTTDSGHSELLRHFVYVINAFGYSHLDFIIGHADGGKLVDSQDMNV